MHHNFGPNWHIKGELNEKNKLGAFFKFKDIVSPKINISLINRRMFTHLTHSVHFT